MTVAKYEERLEQNLHDLCDRVHTGRYRPQPVRRRVYIPKADGGKRPLGVPALEDKIVQGAVAEVLSAVYEADFCGFSYGFRPGRNPHMACRWWRIELPIPVSCNLLNYGCGPELLRAAYETDRGTPQGAGISPLLANIFLHYILDLWVHQWRRRHARGRIVIVRYADDFVIREEG
ncbi:reverse transcriptase domain-containing protein (plasmid) [Sinorhizobium meliloti]